MARTYMITGASGNIGRVIAERLLEQHHAVRVFGRSEERLKALVEAGAKPFVGTLEDTKLLAEAYRGADAVFAMIPPDLRSEDYLGTAGRISQAHVEAVRRSGVRYVVALSSIGAHLSERTGVVQALHTFERDLTALESHHVLVLRPGYFMDNLLVQAPIIKAFGFAASPVKGDVVMPVVYTRDIGEMAAARLANLKLSGHTIEYVLGERDLSYHEITEVLGKTIGKPGLKYRQLPRDQAIAGMTQMGISFATAGLLVDLADAINDGRLLSHYRRTPANTTWTSIEEFSKVFASAYAG